MLETPTLHVLEGIQIYIYIHPNVLCPHMLGFKAFSLHCNYLLLKTFCNLNAHIPLWLHRHIQGLGGMINTWTNQETPGVLLGYHYGSTSLYTSCLDQNKAVHFGDLIRLAMPHIFTVALSHCLHFVSVKELGQTDRERFVFGWFFLWGLFWCAHTGQQRWEIPAVTVGLS